MVDSRITAMVVAVLSGFEKGLTVNINVCSKEGESASIAISEFTKDEASKLLLDALQKNTANKSISFAVTGSKADNKAEEQEESKQVYDLDTPFAEKIPENAEFAWAELVDAFLSIGVESTKQIYNSPTYHAYGECKFAQLLDLKLVTKEFLAQKIRQELYLLNTTLFIFLMKCTLRFMSTSSMFRDPSSQYLKYMASMKLTSRRLLQNWRRSSRRLNIRRLILEVGDLNNL